VGAGCETGWRARAQRSEPVSGVLLEENEKKASGIVIKESKLTDHVTRGERNVAAGDRSLNPQSSTLKGFSSL